MTFHDFVVAARAELEQSGISPRTAALDADLLARHALGWAQATWLARRRDEADASFADRYIPLIARRKTREPVAYIRGVQEFWGREFVAMPGALIPRPETELVIESATPFLARHPAARVADIGTGSGCLAITLALEHRAAKVHATDVSAEALVVARENAARLGATERVRFVEGAYLATVPRPLDLIVSNPPYVAARDARGLAPEVGRHEPAVALFGGEDGLRDVRAILQQAHEALTADGLLVFEIGFDQLDRVTSEIATAGRLEVVEIRSDLQGIPRVVSARPNPAGGRNRRAT